MAPERVVKRFKKLYSRVERELLRRYEEADSIACRLLQKIITIWDRWNLLEEDDSYSDELLDIVGLKSRVLGKQAKVLQMSITELETSMSELHDVVGSLEQVVQEGQAFCASEYKGRAIQVEDEDRTLTISATEYVEGLRCIFQSYQRCYKLKVAVYNEIKSCKNSVEREQLLSYFVAPPCSEVKVVQQVLAKART